MILQTLQEAIFTAFMVPKIDKICRITLCTLMFNKTLSCKLSVVSYSEEHASCQSIKAYLLLFFFL
jgi:hypothetical protein